MIQIIAGCKQISQMSQQASQRICTAGTTSELIGMRWTKFANRLLTTQDLISYHLIQGRRRGKLPWQEQSEVRRWRAWLPFCLVDTSEECYIPREANQGEQNWQPQHSWNLFACILSQEDQIDSVEYTAHIAVSVCKATRLALQGTSVIVALVNHKANLRKGRRFILSKVWIPENWRESKLVLQASSGSRRERWWILYNSIKIRKGVHDSIGYITSLTTLRNHTRSWHSNKSSLKSENRQIKLYSGLRSRQKSAYQHWNQSGMHWGMWLQNFLLCAQP